MSNSVNLLAIEQMDRRLPHLRKAAEELTAQKPRGGWLKALRRSLGISERAFAKRLGYAASGSVQEIERNELSEKITLERLRRAADALDADLVYALVPRTPLRKQIRERARAVAKERLRPIAQTMALEAQSLTKKQKEREIDELAQDLEKHPRELWR
jgi:predicted DNA-binding mobile mystery protein A